MKLFFDSAKDQPQAFFSMLESRMLLSASLYELETVTTQWQGQEVVVYENSWVIATEAESEAEKWFWGVEEGVVDGDLGKVDVVTSESLGDGMFHVITDGDISINELDDVFGGMSGVNYLEPNMELFSAAVPNDPSFDQLWGLHNTGQTGGTADADIDALEAWDIHTGDGGVIVAVIDTGVDYTHPDLIDNMWVNPGEVAGDGVDNDGNGFIDDIYGYDFANDDSDPMDGHDHGTHVAGTIGATGYNGVGVIGVNPNVKIMAIKFLSDSGSGSTADAIESVNYLTMMKRDHGIDIRLSNNSWGGGGFSQALHDAIAANGEQDILFVAAAGNDGSSNDTGGHYPSNYDLDNVISVAATNHNDQLAGFSNYGLTVDIAAPGVDVYSTVAGGGYDSFSGTSMATPHAAGALSLLMSANPGLDGQAAKQLMYDTADVLPQLDGVVATSARLNVNNMLSAVNDEPGPQAPFAMSLTGRSVSENDPGGTIGTINVVDPDAGDAHTFSVSDANFEVIGNTLKLADGVSLDYEATPTVDVDITATDLDGLTLTKTFSINVINVPPTISVTPAAINATVDINGTNTAQLTIENTGEGDLNFNITRDYAGKTSNEAGGPAFNWIDIAATGSTVSLSDDSVSGDLAIGFDFEFYGQTFNTFQIGSNGWISLGGGGGSGSFSNAPMPSGSGVDNMLAFFWDDLNPSSGGQIFYEQVDADTLVVQFENVAFYSASGTVTAQVILKSDGTILYQYENIGTKTSATVGIQENSTNGLNLAYNEAYIEDGMAIEIGQSSDWLSFASESGTVAEGGSEVLTLNIDGASFNLPGSYATLFSISSNDPTNSSVAVPVNLTVNAIEPYLVFDDLAITENVTGASAGTVEVLGPGAAPAYNFSVDDARFEFSGNQLKLLDAVSLDFETEPTVTVNVTATPVGGGDAVLREFTISVTDVDPTIAVEPGQLNLRVVAGGSANSTVTIDNIGDASLNFNVLENSGEYQHFFTTYNWQDISTTGTSVSLSDDSITPDLAIGFDFNFYGQTVDTFQISSNGIVSLGGGISSAPYSNSSLPTSSAPDNSLAFFWDDLNPSNGGTILYEQVDADTLVIQYEQVAYYSGSGSVTTQVILKSDGTILYQYKDVTTTTSATVGIQKDAATGLNLAYNESFVQNGMAVQLQQQSDWLSVSPAQGSVQFGGSDAEINVAIDASQLTEGSYQTLITINSNDPVNGSVNVPVTLTVVEAGPKLDSDVINLSTDSWTTVQLDKSYASPVIVATPVTNSGQAPIITRITNITGDSFDIKLQRVDGNTGTVTADVHYIIVEEGVYNEAEHGFNLEAVAYTSTKTASKNNWGQVDSQAYSGTYNAPVVLGQVMSYNDEDWSSFFAHGSGLGNPANSANLNVGKHVGEDSDKTRADETIGYIVVESGTGQFEAGGVTYLFEAAVGSDSIQGMNTNKSYDPTLNPDVAVLSAAGVDGGDGSWAILNSAGGDPFANGKLHIAMNEDQLGDSERSHTTEQVGYFVISAVDLESDLVAHYEFEDGLAPGSDSSTEGLDNSGAENGSAAVVSDADRGNVLSATSGKIHISDSSDINLGTHTERTIALWFKADSTAGRQVIYEEGGSIRGLSIYIDNGQLFVAGWNDKGSESGWSGTYLQTVAPADGLWHHVALTLHGGASVSADAMTAYLDGLVFGTGSGSQLWAHSDDGTLGDLTGGTKFHDGATGGAVDFAGLLDDVRIYNRSLTALEIGLLAAMI